MQARLQRWVSSMPPAIGNALGVGARMQLVRARAVRSGRGVAAANRRSRGQQPAAAELAEEQASTSAATSRSAGTSKRSRTSAQSFSGSCVPSRCCQRNAPTRDSR